MRIRPAVAADIEAIRTLLIETWHDTYDDALGAEKVTEITNSWHSLENLGRGLAHDGHVFLVAEIEAGMIGTASATRMGDQLTLDRLYVLPRHQRHGCGAALLDACETSFPGALSIQLEVLEANRRGLAFYQRHGFVEQPGERPDSSHIILRKPLKMQEKFRADS